MCDYSLQFVASRPAKTGDRLVSARFANSTTHGLASVGEPNVAVCLAPGTEVAFEGDVRYHRTFCFAIGTVHQRVARFRQIDKNRPDVHHDAFDFPGGHVVLISRLTEGQRLVVLQLPASPAPNASRTKSAVRSPNGA
jgi:hypothetical protein